MSPLAAPARPTGLPIRALANAALWFAVFLGGFVFFEPAPYELFLVLLIPAWLLSGMPIPRTIGPLLLLMTVFLAGGVLTITQLKTIDDQPIYIAVTGFLAASSCFFACVIAQDRSRLDIIVAGWIAGALATTVLAVIGYVGLSGELFTKFGRAAGGFADPNVFGPFLVFPFIVLAQRVLLKPLGPGIVCAAGAGFMLLGIFLSGSRGAWGLAIFALAAMSLLLYLTERRPVMRARYVGLGVAGAICAIMLLIVAVSIPGVGDLFAERAKLDQDYDVGHLGRFARHAIGFNLMLDHPLGIGAHTFGIAYGEDEHNIWLKALTTYGWIGFLAYFGLVLWTLAAAAPTLFRSGPLQHVAQTAYAAFLGHVLLATVIDIDHWRHVYLLFGLLWGIVAIQRRTASDRLGALMASAANMPVAGRAIPA